MIYLGIGPNSLSYNIPISNATVDSHNYMMSQNLILSHNLWLNKLYKN